MKSDQKKLIVEHSALPTCIVDGNGRIDVANSHMDEVFVYAGIKDANIYVLTGFKMENIRAAAVNRKDLLAVYHCFAETHRISVSRRTRYINFTVGLDHRGIS